MLYKVHIETTWEQTRYYRRQGHLLLPGHMVDGRSKGDIIAAIHDEGNMLSRIQDWTDMQSHLTTWVNDQNLITDETAVVSIRAMR